ncbi:MAG: pyridoxal-phosphate-dependent aminotransferase family protein [bacterium]|jgi:alanine-glyoxylate transaminase/serine-glyoxylate transaminase/serine-pyruvate transaminase
MSSLLQELNPPERVLLGPGPSNCSPRVLQALSKPMIGHLDPEFLWIMEQTQEMLRQVFQTGNQMTLPISGTGSSGMETCFVNLVEPGDRVVVCRNGVFGNRMADVATRCGAEVITVDAPWGQIIEPDAVREKLAASGQIKLLAIVHAETSTGVLQPLEEISAIVHEHDALFLVDTVTSLGGVEVKVDEWGIDAVYSGTQKCLSCPPGLSPVSFSERAMQVLRDRRSRVQSWYLDLTMICQYWGSERVYHHTAPISMNYAIHEALRDILEEGLEYRFRRHLENSELLRSELAELDIHFSAQEGYQLPTLNAVTIPKGADDLTVRKRLLQEYGIEIGVGLGEFKGNVWRIGLMGYSSQKRNVLLLKQALNEILK